VNLADAVASAHAQNEAALAARIAPFQMDSEAQRSIGAFIRWCADNGLRSCPAAPAAVAAFVRSMGASKEEIAEAVAAIVELHDSRGQSNPVATAAVRAELIRVGNLKPPRSWRNEEKLLFVDLPLEIQATVGRREEQRDTELRRLQNEVAKLRHGGAKPAIKDKEIKQNG
jgi:hypothetical protein